MALGKYSRVDNRRSSSSYCSTVTIVVFVALCLVGIWMLTSSSVVPVQNIDVPQENKNLAKSQVIETNEGKTQPFEDNPGDLPDDARKGDDNEGSTQQENQEEKPEEKPEEKSEEKPEEKPEEKLEEKPEEQNEDKNGGNEETKPDDGRTTEDGESKEENAEQGSESKSEGGDNGSGGQGDSEENSNEKQSNSNDTDEKKDEEKKTDDSNDTKDGENNNGQEGENVKLEEKNTDDTNENNQSKTSEEFPSGAQSELLNETSTQNGAWSTQAAESKNEKETQRSSTKQSGYVWKLCNVTAGSDYIPCLDNLQAIRSLPSTKHYEHRERHCPEEPPTCLVSLPEGYRRPIAWPTSREKV